MAPTQATIDDVEAKITEWLENLHGIEADVNALLRLSEQAVEVAIRTDEVLGQEVTDGLRSHGFEVAEIGQPGRKVGDPSNRSVWVCPMERYEGESDDVSRSLSEPTKETAEEAARQQRRERALERGI